MKFSPAHVFYSIGSIIGLGIIMIYGRSLLIPLSFALLLAFMLYPVNRWLRNKGWNDIFASLGALFLFLLSVSGVLTFFSNEVLSLTDQWSTFRKRLLDLYSSVILFFNENVPWMEELDEQELVDDAMQWLSDSWGDLLGRTFSESTSFLSDLFMVILFAFLLLLFHKTIVVAARLAAPANKEDAFMKMLKEIQEVGQKYLVGMVTLIAILGLLNSIGLWIIGVDTPFLFGFLAAFLAVIPYIGTAAGAAIPIVYTLMAYDSIWMPISVAILFWGVQILEGNFLNPKIVGKSVNINAFTAILSLFLGAAIWGLSGMILFLPFAAMLKVICRHYESLEPLAVLMDDERSGESSDRQPWWKFGFGKAKDK
jgi:predicted PurR-regulated permease PerM